MTEAEATTSDRHRRSSRVGARTEAFDPTIPVGAVVSQDPAPGVIVAPASPVDYRRVQGPGADAHPDAHPDPRPDAAADAPADADPRADAPADADTDPGARNTGNYVCSTLDAATTAIDDRGLHPGRRHERSRRHRPDPLDVGRRPARTRARA